ncbi:PucR family transcriptional regulator [Paenarthrobacter sp. NPDC058040]|uniref:PucR family transcriptional regulator n=1 Tax=unclassified Paenarthrobacter TaxID=2634190 RepID=UPI0036DABF48
MSVNDQVVGATFADLIQAAALGITAEHIPLDAATRKIRWVAYTELEDPTPYLRGGELVLTSAKSFDAANPELAEQFISRLKAAGMVGLGFGIQRIYARVPASVVESAKRLNFPLLSIPSRTSFATVNRFVTDLVAQHEREIYQQPLADQQDLIRASVRGDAPLQITKILHRSTNGWAAVWTSEGNVVAESGLRQKADDVIRQIRDLADSGRKGAASLHDSGWHCRILAIGTELDDGYLSLCTRDETTEPEHKTLATAALLLSAFSQRQRVNQQIEQKLQLQLLTALFDGKFETAEAVVDLLGLHVFRDGVPVSVAVIEPLRADLLTDILNRLHSVAGLIVGPYRDGAIAISAHSEARLSSILTPILKHNATAGVAVADGLRKVSQVLGRAVAAATRSPGDDGVVRTFDEMMSATNPFGMDAAEGLRWSKTILAPMLPAASGDNAELLRTLTVYLESHGQWSTASRRLFVHRTTLKQRIDKIESLLGTDLDDVSTRMRLWFALQNLE